MSTYAEGDVQRVIVLHRTGTGTAPWAPLDEVTDTPSTTSAVVTAVDATTSEVELGSNRAARAAMTVYNEPGSSVLYLKFGTGASLTSYSNRLGPGDYWESSPPKYSGPVTAVWDGTTGGARISEFLP